MGFPMMEIPVMDKKGGNSDTQVMWNNWVHLFILRGFLQSLQITWLITGFGVCLNDRCRFKPSLGQGTCPRLSSNLPNSRTTIEFLKITHHFNLQYLENGIYCLLHWLLSSNSTERVYPARPGPILEFFKYLDPARFCKNATRSTSTYHTHYYNHSYKEFELLVYLIAERYTCMYDTYCFFFTSARSELFLYILSSRVYWSENDCSSWWFLLVRWKHQPEKTSRYSVGQGLVLKYSTSLDVVWNHRVDNNIHCSHFRIFCRLQLVVNLFSGYKSHGLNISSSS